LAAAVFAPAVDGLRVLIGHQADFFFLTISVSVHHDEFVVLENDRDTKGSVGFWNAIPNGRFDFPSPLELVQFLLGQFIGRRARGSFWRA